MFCGFLKVFIASTALKVWGYTYSLTPPLFIEVPVPAWAGDNHRLKRPKFIYIYYYSIIIYIYMNLGLLV